MSFQSGAWRRHMTTSGLAAGLALAVLSAGNTAAFAQDSNKSEVKNWQASVNPASAQNGQQLDPKSSAIISKVNAYFNNMNAFKGRFVQTNPDDQKMKGRFYVARPGKMRFDYSPPSALRIVSNGRYLSIEDHDLKTVDRYPLDSTPFGILLAKQVDLFRDAKIVEITEGKDYVTLTIEDRNGKTAGQIKLFFANDGKDYTLKEWIITDPQGLNTKIEVGKLKVVDDLKNDFFALSNIDLEKALE